MLKQGGVVVEEGTPGDPEPERPIVGPQPATIYRLPLTKLAKESAGTTLARNMVALGALSQLFGLPEKELRHSIEKMFARKGAEITEGNLKAFSAGKDYATHHITKTDKFFLRPGVNGGPRLVMTGNDAVAYGALLAGCRFFAGYPITPSSEIMEWLSVQLPKFGGTMIQTEDEMAALGMVLGASLAGIKAMTATSGPGLSLMTEMLGLASIAEIPCVVVDVQRGGPSTGIPTKSEQSDLMHAAFGGHGDFPRVVMAPADVSDCFEVMREAFYTSEKYQLPVIVLSDGFIGQCKAAIGEPDVTKIHPYVRSHPDPADTGDYKRFALTADGVSPMSIPGIDNRIYRAAGIEHDEKGAPTSDFIIHQQMNEKRFRKLKSIMREVNFMRHYGPEEAEVGVIAWGSSKGAVREAVETLNDEGYKVSAVIPQVLFPLDVTKLEPYFRKLKRLLVVELSFSKQFLNLLKAQLELPPGTVHYGRSGAKPLAVGEVIDQLKKIL